MSSGFFKEALKPYANQIQTKTKILECQRVFDQSDPGTGKTGSNLITIAEIIKRGEGRALVLAPKAILEPSWQKDATKFTPHLTTAVAHANNRLKAFKQRADITITNHDAVRGIMDNQELFDELDDIAYLVIDESTAFKNPQSDRSKAVAQLVAALQPKYIVLATGTPNPNGVLDLWHQTYLLDGGQTLGTSYWKFRQAVCEPQQQSANPAHVKWVAKDGALEAIADLIAPMVIRHRLDDCTDIPPNTQRFIHFDLTPKHRRAYDELAQHAVVLAQEGTISALNRAVLRGKLLQMASGAVYDDEAVAQTFATERYELVAELAAERPQTVIAFTWKHQKDALLKALKKHGRNVGVIDGTTKTRDLPKIVDAFQAGELTDILAHPKSASHGLTLTAGHATIWTSPTDDAERFQQFNRRIYRNGQTKKTETIMVCASDTLDQLAYDNTNGKVDSMDLLLAYAHALQDVA